MIIFVLMTHEILAGRLLSHVWAKDSVVDRLDLMTVGTINDQL